MRYALKYAADKLLFGFPFFSVSWNFCLFHVYRESKNKSSPVEKVSDKDVLQEFCCKIKISSQKFCCKITVEKQI